MSAPIPALLPNEFIGGYVSRMAMCSGKAHDYKSGHRFDRLIGVTGFDAMSVVYGHSCLAYARFVSTTHAGKPVHLHADLHTNRRFHFLGTAPNLVRCCERCVIEDTARWGCGYWRRDHQLPGIELCDDHQTPLIELPRASLRRPLALTALEATVPSNSPAVGNSVLQRFAILSRLALATSKAIHPRQMANALASRAAVSGIRVRDQRKGRRLSDVVRDQVPAAWLSRHFRGSTEPGPQSRADTLDGVFRTGSATYRTASYLLAMATLWECPQDAVAACVEVSNDGAGAANETAGLRVLKAVLAGDSIRTACRREHASASDFERALRQFLPQGIDTPACSAS